MSIIRIAVAAALLAAVSSQQLSTCAGWSSSSQARMACCERSDCDDPALASACCAAGERDDQAQVGIAMVAPLPHESFLLRAPVPAFLPSVGTRQFETPIPHAFRNAVLLI